MGYRAIRTGAAILCILQLSGLPVHAGPVVVNQVLQILGPSDSPVSLRLRNAYDSSEAVALGLNRSSGSTADGTHSLNSRGVNIPDTKTGLFSGIAAISFQQQSNVNIVNQDDVQGTICDCGEILIAGGFPKWPFLFLAVIPLFFIEGGGSKVVPTPNPTPTPTPLTPVPTPTPVPEPATLLLFGTGLAAGATFLRRRRASDRLNEVEKAEAASC